MSVSSMQPPSTVLLELSGGRATSDSSGPYLECRPMPDVVQNNSASTSKPSADSDRAAVADVLDNKGQEFRDDAGHPHPLYVAGTSSPPLPQAGPFSYPGPMAMLLFSVECMKQQLQFKAVNTSNLMWSEARYFTPNNRQKQERGLEIFY